MDLSNLFVYGTLRSSYRNQFAQLLSQNATLLGKARMRGKLYRIRHYPGLKLTPDSDEWVSGELYDLNDPASMLAALDAYEGCGPNDQPPHEYQRVQATARLVDGTDVLAWVYEYNRPVSEQDRLLSGDFR